MDLRTTLLDDFRAELRQALDTCLEIERDITNARGPITRTLSGGFMLMALQAVVKTIQAWTPFGFGPHDVTLSDADEQVLEAALTLVSMNRAGVLALWQRIAEGDS